jgi:DUF917 family protein
MDKANADRMRPLLESEIDQLATGAWVLGPGGGGDPYNNILNLKKLYRCLVL